MTSGALVPLAPEMGHQPWLAIGIEWLRRGWRPLQRRLRRPRRDLQLQETLALGEKRFVAIVHCGAQRFLLGGAANSVTLLAALPSEQSFRDLLERVRPEGTVR